MERPLSEIGRLRLSQYKSGSSTPFLDLRYVSVTAGRFMLPLWFAIVAVHRVFAFVSQGWVGIDVRIYREAALVLLAGGNPWEVLPSGAHFAAPPPTLLFFLPTAFVPLPVAWVAVTAICLASGVFVIRRLDLPIWWVLFPPLVEATIVGNPDPCVLALLLTTGPAAGLGGALKAYAVIPLLAQRRWIALAVAIGAFAVCLPLCVMFLDARESVIHGLTTQAVGLSAWGTWLLVPAVAALVLLRDRGAEWLAVPLLWPATQSHYAVIAMPALRSSPVAAAVMALAIPLAPVAAVGLMVARTLATRAGTDRLLPNRVMIET